jgi:CBS-domain-containing membrane protein
MYKLISILGAALVAVASGVVLTDELNQPLVSAALGYALVLSFFHAVES